MKSAIRIFLAVTSVLLGLLVAAPAGAATDQAPPPPVPLPPVEPFTLPAPDYCDFPVLVTYTKINESVIQETTAPDGTTTERITGYAQATVENETTGKTVTYTISGPGTAVSYPNGTVKSADLTGPNLLWTTKANSFPGVPTLSYTTGHVTFTVDTSGKTTSYHLDGQGTDVCAVLATP